jgi:cytochrome c553
MILRCGALAVVLCATGAPALAQTALTGDAKAGQDKIAMCVGCHGLPEYKTTYPEVYRVPKLGRQNAQYIIAALTEYRKHERPHPSMDAIAGSLSDQDIADIAAYYSQVK